MVVAAPAAHAFTTYETKSYTDDSGLPRYTDPDKKVEQFNSGSVPGQPGSTTFNFEVKPHNGFGGTSNDRFGPAGQYIPVPGMQTFPNDR